MSKTYLLYRGNFFLNIILQTMFWLFYLSLDPPGPPNGKIGRSWRSKEHRSCNLLQIWETEFRLKFSGSAILLCVSSCVNEKITQSIITSGILGNSAKKLFVRRLLLFDIQCIFFIKKTNKERMNRKEIVKPISKVLLCKTIITAINRSPLVAAGC